MTEMTDADANALSDAIERMESKELSENSLKSNEKEIELQPEVAIAQAEFLQLNRSDHTPEPSPEKMDDLEINIEVVFGKCSMPLAKVLQLQEGSLIELDSFAGEPVDICANGKIIAHGEVVIIDGNFGVKMIDFPNLAN